MDETSRNDSKPSKAMEIILWGRDRQKLPTLSRDLWKQVAARCYRDALVVSDMIPSETKWVRLVCGSLTVRAARLGYQDLANQYHSRYLARAGETVDDDVELQVAMDHIVDMEDSYRVSLADFPKR